MRESGQDRRPVGQVTIVAYADRAFVWTVTDTETGQTRVGLTPTPKGEA